MRLKRREDVQWRELSKLELPFVARHWVERSINANRFGVTPIDGLDDVMADPLQPCRHEWDHHALAQLLDRIEQAEVLLVHGSSSEPLVPAVRRKPENELRRDDSSPDHWLNGWVPADSVNPIVRTHLEWVIGWAARTKEIWAPVVGPDTPVNKPEPKEEETITVSNPRWEHIDENKRQNRPTVARVGDTVRLMVDVDPVPERPTVVFDIYDTRPNEAARKVDSTKRSQGKFVGNVASAPWQIADDDIRNPEEERALALQFEGVVADVRSEKADLPVSDVAPTLVLLDSVGPNAAPLLQTEWKILRNGNEIVSGVTGDQDGEVKLEKDGKKVTLRPNQDYDIRYLGRTVTLAARYPEDLSAADQMEGAEERLAMLGYYCGKTGSYAETALLGYRIDKALGEGELDSATSDELNSDTCLNQA